jgi:hypothetical protein
MWDAAGERSCSDGANATGDVSADQPSDPWPARAATAQRKNDEGLQAAFDDIPSETRNTMARFAANQNAGQRMKLPLTLSAKQRKAVHLWAEMNRCEHQSFGYRGRRRLHLSIGGDPGQEGEGGDYFGSEDEEYSDED